MSNPESVRNRVRATRLARNWTQADLAGRAFISRTAVSAIEAGRLVPSVASALSLAAALETTVEDLFSPPDRESDPRWAWEPGEADCRYWLAHVRGRVLAYPVEDTAAGEIAHDGVARSGQWIPRSHIPERATLVMAGCDPAVSLLAAEFARRGRFRLLPLPRSSSRALSLLQQGLVHVAGIHFGEASDPDGNVAVVKSRLGTGYRLLRLAAWEEGVTLARGTKLRSIPAAVRSRLRWVGREPGSGARRCLDDLFSERRRFRHIAYDHRGVAAAVRSGWADAGICLRLVSQEAGQEFLPFRWENFDYCYPASLEDDPRIRLLAEILRGSDFRRGLGELPGYRTAATGALADVE